MHKIFLYNIFPLCKKKKKIFVSNNQPLNSNALQGDFTKYKSISTVSSLMAFYFTYSLISFWRLLYNCLLSILKLPLGLQKYTILKIQNWQKRNLNLLFTAVFLKLPLSLSLSHTFFLKYTESAVSIFPQCFTFHSGKSDIDASGIWCPWVIFQLALISASTSSLSEISTGTWDNDS